MQANVKTRGQRPRLQLAQALALLLFFIAPLAHASLWESSGWALTGKTDAALGYDTNLTASPDGPADFYGLVAPFLTFARHNSNTDFRVNGGATHVEYLNNRQPAHTDLSLNAIYGYPTGDNIIPIYRVTGSWQRTDPANVYLGKRVQTDESSVVAEGYLPLTGKLGLRGTTLFGRETYDDPSLNQNTHGDVSVGLAFQRNERLEMSLNLGGSLSHSTPNDPTRTANDVHSHGYFMTLRARGDLTAKLAGSVFGGFGLTDFSGGYTNRLTHPVGGADLIWTIDPNRALTLTGYSGMRYSPDGEAAKVGNVYLIYSQYIVAQWQFIARAGLTHSVYSREVQRRSDSSMDLGAEFAYEPSRRFRVALSMLHTNQTSDHAFNAYQRSLISLGATYTF